MTVTVCNMALFILYVLRFKYYFLSDVFSNGSNDLVPCHLGSRQKAPLLCESFYDSLVLGLHMVLLVILNRSINSVSEVTKVTVWRTERN